MDYKKVFSYLDSRYIAAPLNTDNPYYHDMVIIQGGAKGADFLAKCWAKEKAVPCEEYPADWSLGKQAGIIRNKRMLEEGKPDLVLAFPGGKGTANMIWQAVDAGIEVYIVGD